MKFRTIMNVSEYKGEVNNQKSLTVPDQSMSIKEILNRYSRGLPIESFKPIYDDVEDPEDYLPDPRTMDLAERQEYVEMVREELNAINSRKIVNSSSETVGLTKTENESE